MPLITGANFGLTMPQGGGVANNNFATQLSSHLLQQGLKEQRADKIAEQTALANQAKDKTERLGAQFMRIRNLADKAETPQKAMQIQRAETARLAQSIAAEGGDISWFTESQKALTPTEMNTFLTSKFIQFGDTSKAIDEMVKGQFGGGDVESFVDVLDDEGRIIGQRNTVTNEVKADPRASKILDPEELEQKLEIEREKVKAATEVQLQSPLGQATLANTRARSEKIVQDTELQQIKIDETKIKNEEKKQEAVKVKGKRANEAQGAIDQINGLLTSDRYEDAFGKAVHTLPELARPQSSIDAIAEINQIRGLISLESRQKLKGSGTISDGEQKILAESATVLANPLISGDLARKELIKLRRLFEDVAERNRVKKVSGDAEIVQGNEPVITSKEQYDALPSGAIFIENGEKYRKP